MNSRNNIAIQLTNVSKTYVIHHMPGRHTDTRRNTRRKKQGNVYCSRQSVSHNQKRGEGGHHRTQREREDHASENHFSHPSVLIFDFKIAG